MQLQFDGKLLSIRRIIEAISIGRVGKCIPQTPPSEIIRRMIHEMCKQQKTSFPLLLREVLLKKLSFFNVDHKLEANKAKLCNVRFQNVCWTVRQITKETQPKTAV